MIIPILVIALVTAIIFIILLWRHQRQNVEKVRFLFNAIDNGDYSFRFREDSRSDGRFNAALNRVKLVLEHARDEQIEREKYFELILESVDTGILVIDEERGIVLRCNNAALHLLNRDAITHISQVEEQLKKMSVRESHTVLQGKKVLILGFSDIKGELANQESDAWIKLIRVLTHEIMNSVTPVISLSETLRHHSSGEQREGLEVINRTSKELIRFVETYRKFSHVPTPTLKLFYVRPFLERMKSLTESAVVSDRNILITVNVVPRDLLVYSDEGLMNRVVSNLLKNAVEAIDTNGNIEMHAYSNSQEQVTIDVSNDGPIIPDDVAAQIFVPFFTTKKEGSGIGLSISRQIMRVCNGALDLLTDKKKGITTFRLTFY